VSPPRQPLPRSTPHTQPNESTGELRVDPVVRVATSSNGSKFLVTLFEQFKIWNADDQLIFEQSAKAMPKSGPRRFFWQNPSFSQEFLDNMRKFCPIN
jgi:hypothetical protein